MAGTVRAVRGGKWRAMAAAGAVMGLAALTAGRPARATAVPLRPGAPGRAAGGGLLAALPGQARPLLPMPPAPVPAGGPPGAVPSVPPVAPLRRLRQADLLLVSAGSLPRRTLPAIRKLPGVQAAEAVDAARVTVNGAETAVLGVGPSAFRAFAAPPTAADNALWRNVAAGDIAVSYTMGRQDRLPVGTLVTVTGRQREALAVGGLGTVGIGGVDAVISRAVARSLGFPAGNAIVISAPAARLAALRARVRARSPAGAVVEQLVIQGPRAPAGTAGEPAATAGRPAMLTRPEVAAVLRAALSRAGLPYVWGAAGPSAFDCSGLVQWSFAQAGIVMPRVAADQARTGPAVPASRLVPGDLLFWHTDPTAPDYISHVAIYLGRGLMIQAPQPGMKVEAVRVAFGPGYAGAVAVSPPVAAQVAAPPVS